MIDAILFDKDGTLFDFRASWSGFADQALGALAVAEGDLPRLAAALGYDPVHRGFSPASVVIAGTVAEIAEVMAGVLGRPAEGLVPLLNRLAAATAMVPAAPLAATLGALRERGLRLGVATNDAEAPARAHLAAHGVLELFDFVAGYDSGHGAKPAPGQLLAFAGAMGLVPGRVAMVGDSRHDLVAARAAGMRPVGVLTGMAGAADLAPLAEVVLPDIAALAGWLDRPR
jgi:phosphoglycolate phosphatase